MPCRKAAPKRCRRCWPAACGISASSWSKIGRPAEIARLVDLYRRLLAGELNGRAGLDRAASGQSGRCHPRHAGRAPQSAGDSVMTLAQHPIPAGTGKLRLVLGTTNRGKIAELLGLLAEKWPPALADAGASDNDWQLEAISPGETAAGADLGEVDENGSTVAENAAIKAQAYARACRQWTLADDTALVVDALGGAPGIHTARFAGPRATAAENRRRLLAELAGVPLERRSAHFLCHLALADPTGVHPRDERRTLSRTHPLGAGRSRGIWLRSALRDHRVSPHVRRTCFGDQVAVEPSRPGDGKDPSSSWFA